MTCFKLVPFCTFFIRDKTNITQSMSMIICLIAPSLSLWCNVKKDSIIQPFMFYPMSESMIPPMPGTKKYKLDSSTTLWVYQVSTRTFQCTLGSNIRLIWDCFLYIFMSSILTFESERCIQSIPMFTLYHNSHSCGKAVAH